MVADKSRGLVPGRVQDHRVLAKRFCQRPMPGEARHGRRRRVRRGSGGGKGVVLEEAEDHDDVPVMVDDADEEDQVDDLAYAYL